MSGIFSTVLNMTLTASIIICVVLLVRLCLRKAPKIYSYILWSVVLFRLLCPFSISLPVSLLSPMAEASTSAGTSYTSSMEYIPSGRDSVVSEQPDALVPGETPQLPAQGEDNYQTNNAQDDTLPIIAEQDEASVSAPAQSGWDIALTVLSWIWAIGGTAVLVVTGLQTMNLRNKLATACVVRGNIYESENIDTAFVLGIFNPKIYLPLNLPFGVQKAVIAHEQTHLRRGDHIVKLVSYIALAIHWFNPLVWLSFKLMCADMEKSCDESAVRKLHERGYEMKSVKGAYSKMLLHLGGGGNLFSPVSFAENNTKERVKSLLSYTRLTRNMTIVITIVLCITLFIGIANPISAHQNSGAYVSSADISPTDSTSAESQDNNIVIDPDFVPEQVTIGGKTFLTDAVSVSLCGYRTSIDLSELRKFPYLQSLDLSFTAEPLLASGPDEKNQQANVIDFSVIGQLNTLRKLNLNDSGVEDLSFLESLVNLESLTIGGDRFISDYSVLKNLVNLKEFYAKGSQIDDLSFLEGNSNLRCLTVYGPDEPFASFPRGMTGLEQLDIHGCTFDDFSGLADCVKLSRLDLSEVNGFSDCAMLAKLTKLEYLNLGNMNSHNIENLDALANLSSLKELYIPFVYTREDGYMFLSGMGNLRKLSISTSDKHSDFSGFKYLTKLQELNLSGVCDAEIFEGCKDTLRTLDLSVIETDLDISGLSVLTNLEKLSIEYSTGAMDVSPLSAITSLEYLDIYAKTSNCAPLDINALNSLVNLEYLSLLNCGISDISALSQMDKLLFLNIECNRITDVSPLYGLEAFSTSKRGSSYSSYSLSPTILLIGNDIPDEQLIELHHSLNRNCSIYSADLSIFD